MHCNWFYCFKNSFMLSFLISLISIVSSSRLVDYYSPCNYPGTISMNSENFFSTCSMNYLGSRIFCDPNSMLTRTDADYIVKVLKTANFSSCYCAEFFSRRLNTLEKCKQFTSEIVFIHRGTLLQDDSRPCSIQTVKNLYHLSLHYQLAQFTKLIQQTWLIERDCSADLFLAAVQTWIGRDPEIFSIIPILSDKLSSILKQHSADLSAVETFRTNSTNLISEVRRYVDRMVKTLEIIKRNKDALKKAQDASKVPVWAIIVLSLCILSVPLCILIGNLVAFSPLSKSTASDHVTIRMANQRYGGEAKSCKPDKGKSSNIMMFRHFQKKDTSASNTIKYV